MKIIHWILIIIIIFLFIVLFPLKSQSKGCTADSDCTFYNDRCCSSFCGYIGSSVNKNRVSLLNVQKKVRCFLVPKFLFCFTAICERDMYIHEQYCKPEGECGIKSYLRPDPDPQKPDSDNPITTSRNHVITINNLEENIKVAILNPTSEDWIDFQPTASCKGYTTGEFKFNFSPEKTIKANSSEIFELKIIPTGVPVESYLCEILGADVGQQQMRDLVIEIRSR